MSCARANLHRKLIAEARHTHSPSPMQRERLSEAHGGHSLLQPHAESQDVQPRETQQILHWSVRADSGDAPPLTGPRLENVHLAPNQPQFHVQLNEVEEGRVHGWACLRNSPSASIQVGCNPRREPGIEGAQDVRPGSVEMTMHAGTGCTTVHVSWCAKLKQETPRHAGGGVCQRHPGCSRGGRPSSARPCRCAWAVWAESRDQALLQRLFHSAPTPAHRRARGMQVTQASCSA